MICQVVLEMPLRFGEPFAGMLGTASPVVGDPVIDILLDGVHLIMDRLTTKGDLHGDLDVAIVLEGNAFHASNADGKPYTLDCVRGVWLLQAKSLADPERCTHLCGFGWEVFVLEDRNGGGGHLLDHTGERIVGQVDFHGDLSVGAANVYLLIIS